MPRRAIRAISISRRHQHDHAARRHRDLDQRGSGNSFSLGPTSRTRSVCSARSAAPSRRARAQYEGSGYDYATVLTSIESEVARNYILARLYQAQLANAQRNRWRSRTTISRSPASASRPGSSRRSISEQARAQPRADRGDDSRRSSRTITPAVSRLGVLTGQAPGALKAELAAVEPIPHGPGRDRRRHPRRYAAPAPRRARRRAQPRRRHRADRRRQGAALSGAQRSAAISAPVPASVRQPVRRSITGSLFAGLTPGDLQRRPAARPGPLERGGGRRRVRRLQVDRADRARGCRERRRRARCGARSARRSSPSRYDAANNSAILSRSQYRAGLTDFTTLNTSRKRRCCRRATACPGASPTRRPRWSSSISRWAAAGTVDASPPRPPARRESTSEDR